MPPKSAPSTPKKYKPSQHQRAVAKAKLQAEEAERAARISGKGFYLIVYNTVSALAWAYCLIRLCLHMGTLGPSESLVGRASTGHADFGEVVKWVQTIALLEVVHAALGLVRSGLGTTIAQVSSRIFMVWYICHNYPAVTVSPFYASMVFAWSVTEVIRYSHYATGLLPSGLAHFKSSLLEWLRYSTFYVLYPLGAGSEATLVYLSADLAKATYGAAGYYGTLAILAIWPPALLFMMTHMHAQRTKNALKKEALAVASAPSTPVKKAIDSASKSHSTPPVEEKGSSTSGLETPRRSTRVRKPVSE